MDKMNESMNQVVGNGVVGDPEARRASGDLNGGTTPAVKDKQTPDPEVAERKQKRYRSGREKLRILKEIDKNPSQKGAIIRREGIYSSYITRWEKERTDGTLLGLSGKKRGRKEDPAKNEKILTARLQRENARLENELKKCRIIIEVQKKVSEMLGIQPDPILKDLES